MNANDVSMICDAITKLGVAGKEAFFAFMIIKAITALIYGGVIIYFITLLFKTIVKCHENSDFCRSLARAVSYSYRDDSWELNEEAKRAITKFTVENLTGKKQ